MTVAQISDAHLTSLGWVEESLVERVNEADASLVVLTGDLVDDTEQLGVLGELCAALRRPGRTVLATLGNWEHWGHVPPEDLRRVYRGEGVQLLVNESVEVHGLRVGATDDATGGAPRARRVLAELAGQPSLFLTHSPGHLDQLPAAKVSLTLSGHTHGGQVAAGPWAIYTPPGSGRFVAGYYDTPVGKAYVSRGTGTSVIPARFCARPELPIFRLEKA